VPDLADEVDELVEEFYDQIHEKNGEEMDNSDLVVYYIEVFNGFIKFISRLKHIEILDVFEYFNQDKRTINVSQQAIKLFLENHQIPFTE
jgi:hypothetical protein